MAVALAAYSAYQGMKAQDAASDEAEKQRQMEEKNMAFNQQRYQESQARRDKEEALFRPIKERVIGEAMADKPAGWDRSENLINQQYGDVVRRASMGNANSGINAALVQGAGLQRASTLTSAYADAKERQRQALTGLMGVGMQSAQSMTGDVNQAGSQYGSQMGNTASSYGRNAAMMGQAASNAYGQAISGLGTAWSDAGGWKGVKEGINSGIDTLKGWYGGNTGITTNSAMNQSPMEPLPERQIMSTYGLNIPKQTDMLSERPSPGNDLMPPQWSKK
jgi:hypothetical protein